MNTPELETERLRLRKFTEQDISAIYAIFSDKEGYLLWGLDKGSIANQSAISLIIRATGICWNQVGCKGMAEKQRLCLKIKKLSETQRSK